MIKLFQWIKDNPNRAMFLVPIFLVAGISISHVVAWYDIANPISWAIYLSIAIEVGAMTALVAATNRIKGGVWFMFVLVTIIQMIGNIFYSFKEIDANGDLFKSWVELTSPLWEMLGSDPGDIISQKRWLAFLEGGLLPIISLTSLHFFTKYDKNQSDKEVSAIDNTNEDISDEEYDQILYDFVRKEKEQEVKIKYTPTKDDLQKLDNFLKTVNYKGPEEVLNKTEKYTPNEQELSKINEILLNYSKPETVEFKLEDSIDEDINKVFFESYESDDELIEDVINVNLNEEIEEIVEQEVKPEPVEENRNKVLNYFK